MKVSSEHYDHKEVKSKRFHTVGLSRTSRSKPSSKARSKQLAYDHREIEQKWRKLWEDVKTNQVDLACVKKPFGSSGFVQDKSAQGKPFYNLMMFPYPSAEGLHVGNMYAITGSDIYGRFKRRQGYSVFEPIGLDGFGIHSENYALRTGRHPMEHAKITEKAFYRQLHQIGAMFDWSRTLETYDPDYYRWTQWLFVQMFKHGLAYRGKARVNWCPSCKTVLADEQVIANACERCGNIVEDRVLEQWFFRITAHAGKLLENLGGLDWSAKVKIAQENWIGKKEGIDITYPVVDSASNAVGEVTCFTTRPDTNFGATFVVLAPEHPFVAKLLNSQPTIHNSQLEEIRKYAQQAKERSKDDRIAAGRQKTGVFTGLYCINQLNNYKMPLYISDFVVMDVGTGAVVGVPGHDKRDFEFAQAMKLPIVRVVKGKDGDTSPIIRIGQVQEEDGTMVNSDFLNGLPTEEAIRRTMDYLEEKGWGKRRTTYHLRDWLISRQRYWGPPIPMIYCSSCAKRKQSWFTSEESRAYRGSPFASSRQGPDQSGVYHGFSAKTMTGLEKAHRAARSAKLDNLNIGLLDNSMRSMAGWYPVPEDQLPVILPRIEDYKPGDDGVAPLAKHKEFYHVVCPECSAIARRETDVSDTFLDSAWYFLRYPSIGSALSGQAPFDPEITKKWLPVDMYTGGAEHSVLHLMYSRFVTMALHDWGYLHFEEPFTRFYAHGLVIKDGAKMSKSKGNVVNPDEYIASYGVDALRLYLMFMGPFDQGGDFRDTAMEGMSRWVRRVWRLAMENLRTQNSMTNKEVQRALHKLVKKVTEDTEKRHYNTAIAAMMEFSNLVEDQGGALAGELLKIFVLLLAPFAPHLSEELWQRIKNNDLGIKKDKSLNSFNSVHEEPWPQYDAAALAEETVALVIQVNGKLRDVLRLRQEAAQNQEEIEKQARSSSKVKQFLLGKNLRKVVFIPGRLINFVLD